MKFTNSKKKISNKRNTRCWILDVMVSSIFYSFSIIIINIFIHYQASKIKLSRSIGYYFALHRASSIEYRVSSIQYRVSSIQYRVSSIEHPVSSIQHPVSSIQHRASSIEYPVSSIQHRASSIQHRVSSIEYRASSIQHPALFLPVIGILPMFTFVMFFYQ